MKTLKLKANGNDNLKTWIEDENGKRVANMVPSENDWDLACLLASAPEMKDALGKLRDWLFTVSNEMPQTYLTMTKICDGEDAVKKMLDVLAKAERGAE